MRLLLLATLCACGFGDPTTININFEGIFEGLNWGNGPTPTPAPGPTPKVWLPIPNASLPLTPTGQSSYDQSYFSVSEIGNAGSGVYFTSNTFYNGFFIVEPNGVWVFDVPGIYVLSAIKSVTNKSITHIVYSHTHIDHIGATGSLISNAQAEGRLAANLVIIGSQPSADHLTEMNDTNRPVPTQIVSNQTFVVGSHSVQISVLPVVGHLEGSFIIWVPTVSLVMTVDVAFPGWAPFYHLGMAQEYSTLIPVCDAVLAYNFTTFIGGHLGRPGNRADVQQQKDYINSVFEYAGAAQMTYGSSSYFGQAYAQSNNNPWVAIKIYADLIADKCYENLLARWGGILAGIDVVGPDHCWVICEHIRIN